MKKFYEIYQGMRDFVLKQSEPSLIKVPHRMLGANFSIIPQIYESKLDKKYSIVLGNLKRGKPTNILSRLEQNVTFNGGNTHFVDKINSDILNKYKSIPDFCSIDIPSMDDLFEHIQNIYEISYNHYAWAMETNLGLRFPYCCCGNSSRNVFLTLMDKGYPNASYVYNSVRDHAYVALPFILRESDDKGFIVVDPTSDQLFYDKKHAPRNNLFVVFGDEWVYKTDWKFGENLYPSPDDDSKFSNLYTLRKKLCASKYSNGKIDIYSDGDIEKYFKNVFKNPVKVNINQRSL